MVHMRTRPKGALAPFGLSALVFVLMPTQIGFQDLAALIARQPAVTAHWRAHVDTSPFPTIRAATFSFPRPIGTAIPEPAGYTLASLDPRGLDFTRAVPEPSPAESGTLPPPLTFPRVNRANKGDALIPPSLVRPPLDIRPSPAYAPRHEMLPNAPPKTAEQPSPPDKRLTNNAQAQPAPLIKDVASAQAPARAKVSPRKPSELASAAHDMAMGPEPVIDSDLSLTLVNRSPLPEFDPYEASESDGSLPKAADALPVAASAAMQTARIYFGVNAVGPNAGEIKRWAPGEEPVLVQPGAADPDVKLSALEPAASATEKDKDQKTAADKGGETVAPKGEVTGKNKRPQSPAERLKLTSNARAKAEKCLAEAVYFEARGEPIRGQMAVAQVVINRVFTEFYPKTVCGVVYQNANRKYRCQFTFACDNVRDVIREPDMWAQAKRIAKDALDGRIWVPEVGKATHYHAYWVRPSWTHEMHRLYKLGVHTFYRPRAWGDGSDIPNWGQTTTKQEIKSIAAAAKKAKL
jgi:spore germination cell wall hydrolase CwlJ-like protein